MSRIQSLFTHKSKKVLNVYCTAGFPELNDTIPIIQHLEKYGADLVEIGMPYSDPLADGTTIQASSARALANGMTIATLFTQLMECRNGANTVHLPIVLMGYMNPVLQYGFEQFCADAGKAGVDGLILPDLPPYEYETMYGAIIKKYGLDFIFLVTPESTPERIHQLDALSSGFLYAVSSSSTTGNNQDVEQVKAYVSRLEQMNLKNPILVGFGIKDKASFDAACLYSNGAIIGSAYIKAIENSSNIAASTESFLNSILY